MTAINQLSVEVTYQIQAGGRTFDHQLKDLVFRRSLPENMMQDRRLAPNNCFYRRNIATRIMGSEGNRPHQTKTSIEGQVGRQYEDMLYDPKDDCTYPKHMFRNMAVRADIRKVEGFNVHARHHQIRQYSRGYKLDGFVVSDDDDDDDEYSSDGSYDPEQD